MKRKPHIDGKGWRIYKKDGSFVTRPNKVAVHYQRKATSMKRSFLLDSELLRLAVHGTCDRLASRKGILAISKTTAKPHPTDRGYFKIVYVLTTHGRNLLNRKRKEHERREAILIL